MLVKEKGPKPLSGQNKVQSGERATRNLKGSMAIMIIMFIISGANIHC